MRARGILALGVVFVVLGGLNACGDSGEVVARVGGSPIAKAKVDHWLSVLAGGGTAVDRPSSQDRALRGPLLSFLISSQWILGEAADAGVSAKDSEAQARLELLSYGQGEALNYLGLSGRDELHTLLARARNHADRLWLMKLALLASRLEEKHIAKAEQGITPTQIESYYRAHRSLYVLPERRDVEWIVTYSESTLQRAVREIRAGKSFVSVAKRVSQDAPMIYGMERHPDREKQLARHVFAAKPHVITGPFLQTANHYVFEVTKIIPARLQTLAQSEASIRRRLAAQLTSTSLPQALERKWRARTSCRPRYVVSGCGG